MSVNQTGRAIEFRVKSGSKATLYINIKNYDGTTKNLNDATQFASAVWKVWRPNGDLIIDGNAFYEDRTYGEIGYTLTSEDTDIDNAGIWEGEVELYDDDGEISEQSDTFNFIIEESYQEVNLLGVFDFLKGKDSKSEELVGEFGEGECNACGHPWATHDVRDCCIAQSDADPNETCGCTKFANNQKALYVGIPHYFLC